MCQRLSIEERKAIYAEVLHPQPQAVHDEAAHHRMPAVQHTIAPAANSRQS